MKKISFLLAIIMLIGMIPVNAIAYSIITIEKDEDCVHDWDEWDTYRSATVNKRGVMIRYCFDCASYQKKYTNKLKPFAKFTKKTVRLKVGKKAKLKVKYARGDKVKKWRSTKKSVVRVNKKGKIRAIKKGTAYIIVRLKSGKRAKCKVVVKAPKKKSAPKKSSSGTVYWTPSGSVYHKSRSCPTLSRSRVIHSGSIAQSGKPRCCKVCG